MQQGTNQRHNLIIVTRELNLGAYLGLSTSRNIANFFARIGQDSRLRLVFNCNLTLEYTLPGARTSIGYSQFAYALQNKRRISPSS